MQRTLPPSAQPTETPHVTEAITSQAKPDAEGWLDVCDLDQLLPGEPVRFEHDNHAYAIYRTSIGQLFASDGLCTHGNGQLTDGFLQGTCIECPKHNGRFEIRDGSVRRPPPRVPLKTHPVRHKGGKVQLKVA